MLSRHSYTAVPIFVCLRHLLECHETTRRSSTRWLPRGERVGAAVAIWGPIEIYADTYECKFCVSYIKIHSQTIIQQFADCFQKINIWSYFTWSILTHKKLQKHTQTAVLSCQLLATVKYKRSDLMRSRTRNECGSQVCELTLCHGVSAPGVSK
jgi:hypothetical protein